MFGNLIRESGVVERLSEGAQNELTNLTTLFLGLVIGSTMEGQAFIKARPWQFWVWVCWLLSGYGRRRVAG